MENETFTKGDVVRRVYKSGKLSVATYTVHRIDERGVWVFMGGPDSLAGVKAYRPEQLVAVGPTK